MELEHVVKKAIRETRNVGQQRAASHSVIRVQKVYKVLMDCVQLLASIQGPPGIQGPVGSNGEQGERGFKVDEGIKGSVVVKRAKGVRGERGEHGAKRDKGIHGTNSNVLDVLAEHLPIQLATRYGAKMCFIKYHVSEDSSSIVELARGVGTLHCVSAYHEPAWHFDAKFVDGEIHEMANVNKATGYGYFLEMKNSAYYCTYDLASTKVNVIYMVYKIRKYGAGTEHNYLFSCGMGDNHRGICFLQDEKTTRVYGAV